MGENTEILISVKNITLLPAIDAEAEEGKQHKLRENENFTARQELSSLVTQQAPFGKTLWDILPPTEEGCCHSLVLARQRFPLAAACFTTSSRLLQPSCHCPKQLYPGSAVALVGSVEQCCPASVQGSRSYGQWEAESSCEPKNIAVGQAATHCPTSNGNYMYKYNFDCSILNYETWCFPELLITLH